MYYFYKAVIVLFQQVKCIFNQIAAIAEGRLLKKNLLPIYTSIVSNIQVTTELNSDWCPGFESVYFDWLVAH